MHEPFYFTGAYVLGMLAAISYKVLVPALKHRMRQEFQLRLLVIPSVVGIMLALPLVFMALPALGPPRGVFVSDFAYAFFTAYTVLDVVSDLFRLQEEWKRYIERKTGRPPVDPTG